MANNPGIDGRIKTESVGGLKWNDRANRFGMSGRIAMDYALGSNYNFPVDQWPFLSDRISNILAGTLSLLPLEAVVEDEAQRLANLIIHKHGRSIDAGNNEPIHESININSVENSEVKSIGAESLAFETTNVLGLHELLLEIGLNKKQADLSLASIIGRLLSPGSDVSTCNYLRNKSALDEVMDVDFSNIHKRQMYETSDLLWKHKDQIESKLYQREKDLFNFEEVVTLYDLTNTYFEGESKANDNAAFGRSKEKRRDCKLVTLALVLDSSGFPKKSHIFKGNVSEGTTLEEISPIWKEACPVFSSWGLSVYRKCSSIRMSSPISLPAAVCVQGGREIFTTNHNY